MSKNWLNKHFEVIENNLMKEENGLLAFTGFQDYGMKNHKGKISAYLITDKRIIIARKKIIGEETTIVSRKNLNDITFKKGLAYGTIIFDTYKEEFSVGILKKQSQNVFNLIQEELKL